MDGDEEGLMGVRNLGEEGGEAGGGGEGGVWGVGGGEDGGWTRWWEGWRCGCRGERRGIGGEGWFLFYWCSKDRGGRLGDGTGERVRGWFGLKGKGVVGGGGSGRGRRDGFLEFDRFDAEAVAGDDDVAGVGVKDYGGGVNVGGSSGDDLLDHCAGALFETFFESVGQSFVVDGDVFWIAFEDLSEVADPRFHTNRRNADAMYHK